MTEVTVYTRQLCGYCIAAKNLFLRKGINFTEYDATYDPDLRKLMVKRSAGASTFPQIFIGDVHIGGCDDLMAMDRSGKLALLLKA